MFVDTEQEGRERVGGGEGSALPAVMMFSPQGARDEWGASCGGDGGSSTRPHVGRAEEGEEENWSAEALCELKTLELIEG